METINIFETKEKSHKQGIKEYHIWVFLETFEEKDYITIVEMIEKFESKAQDITRVVNETAVELGGSYSGEHGIGLVLKEYNRVTYCSTEGLCEIGAGIIQSGRYYRERLIESGNIYEQEED